MFRNLQLTVTLGDLLSMGVTVVAIVGAYGRIRERLAEIDVKVGPLWAWWNGRAERRAEPRDR